nr:hypothetical protein [Providencia rettgeri]
MIPPENSPDAHFEQLVGKKIGSGTSRCVHELNGDNSKVIKIAKQPPADSDANPSICNFNEWKLYTHAKNTGLAKVESALAEVFSISETGKYLIMEKLVTPLPASQRSNMKYPSCISDAKAENFGMSGSTVKMLDYAALHNDFAINSQIDTSTIKDQLTVIQLSDINGLYDIASKLNDIYGDSEPLP